MHPDAKLSTPRLAVFTAPILGVEFIIYPTLAILPAFYASFSGRGAAEFGTALLISRSIYSWSGPLVGYLSDRFNTPWGRRKPWMIAGLALALVSVVMLFRPPPGAGPVYFAWASSLALASFSLIDVPYIAWGSEITRDPQERSRIAVWRMGVANLALLLFLGLPYIPIFGGADFLNPIVIGRLGIVAFAIVAITVLAGVRFGPPAVDGIGAVRASESLRAVARNIACNRPFWSVAGATFLSYVAFSIVLTLQFAFCASLGLVKEFGILSIVSIVAAVVAMPAWNRLASRIGKRPSWAIGLLLAILSAPIYFAVDAFAGKLAAVCVSLLVFNAASVVQFMPYSVIGDVIDYDELRTGTNHAGNYSGILLVIIRLTTAVGGALAFYVLALYHFRIGAANAPAEQNGMLVAFFVVPAVLNALALAIALAYPLSERRHAAVARRLAKRRRGPLPAVEAPS